MSRMSGETAYDRWPEPRGDGQRQPLPQLDKHPELGVERVQIGDLASRRKPELIDQRGWLKAPKGLEVIGAGAKLAAAEVEQTKAALAGAPHHLPVHEVVCRQAPRFSRAAAVIGQHLV